MVDCTTLEHENPLSSVLIGCKLLLITVAATVLETFSWL